MNPLERQHYDAIRKKLDLLGYQFHFPADSLLLVEHLLSDLEAARAKVNEQKLSVGFAVKLLGFGTNF